MTCSSWPQQTRWDHHSQARLKPTVPLITKVFGSKVFNYSAHSIFQNVLQNISISKKKYKFTSTFLTTLFHQNPANSARTSYKILTRFHIASIKFGQDFKEVTYSRISCFLLLTRIFPYWSFKSNVHWLPKTSAIPTLLSCLIYSDPEDTKPQNVLQHREMPFTLAEIGKYAVLADSAPLAGWKEW